MQLVFAEPLEDRKRILLRLQWLVVLATSYLLVFRKGEVAGSRWNFTLTLLLVATIPVLYRLPRWSFDHRLFAPMLVVSDTILISAAITLNRESPWDLFLLFFFGLFITAIGENLVKVVAGCLLISIFSVVINPFTGLDLTRLEPDLLYRIPFLFAVSILYAYLADVARKEKKRAETAEGTERLKRQLVSALAHDIKNPLGIIVGYAEAVAANVDSSPRAKESLEALDRIQDNAQRIVKLVTGFLEASKAEAGKLEMAPKPLQPNSLLREVGQQQIAELRQKDIELKVELDDHLPEIMADEVQIDRVLWNLVGNAIKFTPRGGTVTLGSKVEDGKVCITVSDTGMGIPKEELPLLFTEFRRLKGAMKVEGTGLGLFIVKTIVEAHGGTVGVESEVGKGSTFTIRLPMKP